MSGRWLKTPSSIALPLLVLAGYLSLLLPTAAQTPLQTEPQTPAAADLGTTLVVAPPAAESWLELTSLTSDAPAQVVLLETSAADAPARRLPPELPAGPALLCSGGAAHGVHCREIYVYSPGSTSEEGGDVEVTFAAGAPVTGRYLLDGQPVAGARVAVVPAGLETVRPFTLPLAADDDSGALVREVTSDTDGGFTVPPLAPGRYFLETLLPSGRVHRNEPFDLPDIESMRADVGAEEGEEVSWDLGEIEVADALAVEVQVSNPEGQPIAGAQVLGRQGRTRHDLVTFEAVSGADGVARLSGMTAESPAHLACRAPGFESFEQDFELVPALVECVLAPYAAVTGTVLDGEGVAVPGATVSVAEPAGENAGAVRIRAQPVDPDGRFTLPGLTAGEHELTAAAPGYAVETRTFTVAAGEALELEAISLLPGDDIAGRVLDAETREPIAGAEIAAVSPPGAVRATSDAEGAFTLRSRFDAPLVLEVSAEEYASRRVTVAAGPAADRPPLEVALDPGGYILAVVAGERTGDGEPPPCTGCALVLRPGGEELRTDARGEALFGPLADGWYRVERPRLAHLGSTVVAEPDAEVRSVRVEPGRTSTVRFGGRSGDLRVVLQPSAEPGWRLSVRTPAGAENVAAEPDGSFVVARRPGVARELYLLIYDPAAGVEMEIRQGVLPGTVEGERFVLARHGARITGRATSREQPVAGASLRLLDLAGAPVATTRTRPDGSFELPFLPPGVYAVAIGDLNAQFVSLRPGQQLTVGPFEVPPGSF